MCRACWTRPPSVPSASGLAGVEQDAVALRLRRRRRSARGSSSPDSRSAWTSDWISRCESVCSSTYGPPGNGRLALAVLRPALVPAREVHRAAARPPAARASSCTASARSWTKMPSPRFSTAGNHCGSSAICARSTSVSYSPLMSGVTASKRVKPTSASTSRRRWSWITASMPSRAPGAPPRSIGQPARVKVRIDRHVVAKALGRGEQRVELDLLHRPLAPLARSCVADGREHLLVAEGREPLRDPRLPLQEGEVARVVDDLQVVPQLGDDRLAPRVPRSGSDSTLTTCGK